MYLQHLSSALGGGRARGGVVGCVKSNDLAVRMDYVRDEVDIALDAVEARDYPAAVAILAPLVEQGNAKATLNLALLYSCGWGVPLDAPKAAEMYEGVGKLGIRERLISAIAYNNLAAMYAGERPGIDRDDQKAGRSWRLAEELGLPSDRFVRKARREMQ
jgi:TPR repeat protein